MRLIISPDAQDIVSHGVNAVEAVKSFYLAPGSEVIRLKDKGADDRGPRLCKYTDTAETTRMRSDLSRINALLSRTSITSARRLTAADYSEPSSPYVQRTTLHRVFNRSSFDLGGRFYGGWWQLVKKEARQDIRINGQRTVEFDYSGLHPAILFAERGLTIPADPYEAVPCPTGPSGAWRDAVKETFNAMLNAEGQTLAPGDFDLGRYGLSRKEFQQMIRDAFPAFRDLFGSGEGLRLQRADSDLMETILLQFADRGVPVLPIHDSAIIQEDKGADRCALAGEEWVKSQEEHALTEWRKTAEQDDADGYADYVGDTFGNIHGEEEMDRLRAEETATETLRRHEQEERQARIGGPGLMLVFDDTMKLEKVPMGSAADRIMEHIQRVEPVEVHKFRIRNEQSLRELWANDAAAALEIKKEMEKREALITEQQGKAA